MSQWGMLYICCDGLQQEVHLSTEGASVGEATASHSRYEPAKSRQ